MTRDEIILMVQEANRYAYQHGVFTWHFIRDERLAALVAAAEREACAEVCDCLLANPHTGGGWSDAIIEAAATIRARGETK